MTFIPNNDYNLNVLSGNVSGHSMLKIMGHNAVLGTTRVGVNPTNFDISQSAIYATPATVKVSSTSASDAAAGVGLRTMTLTGLSSAGAIQSETITLNGTTEVVSSLTYKAVNGMLGLTVGSTGWNVGTIYVGTGVVTAGVPAVKCFMMGIRELQGLSAYYVVPTGYKLYFRGFSGTVADASKICSVFFAYSTNGGVMFITESVFGLESGVYAESPITATQGFVAGTHIKIEGINSSGTADMSVIIKCELVAV